MAEPLGAESIDMSNQRGARKYLRAVIYVFAQDRDRALRRCIDSCAQRHRKVVGLIIDPTYGDNWVDAILMCVNGEADIIVVDDRDALPPDRVSRVESSTDAAPPPGPVPSQRRARTVRRTGK